MKIQLNSKLEDIVSLENLLDAWQKFVCGKRGKSDVQIFSHNLFDNILQLHEELVNSNYNHGKYKSFWVFDPKPRHIHKASVRDRVLHHAIYKVLYPFFDRVFIADSFSCRNKKGTHKAINQFRKYIYKVSRNNKRTCWVLKCDIKKFFDSIDHKILIGILESYIPDNGIRELLRKIINSFEKLPGKGLPLGNLTSQLFCNVYMNELDQFVKHKLKARHYLRYADDFAILSENKNWLEEQISKISSFLGERLSLSLHPWKVSIETIVSGVDFLGWVHFPDHRVLRTVTKRRMMKKINENPADATLQSYLGLLSHGNTTKIRKKLLDYSRVRVGNDK